MRASSSEGSRTSATNESSFILSTQQIILRPALITESRTLAELILYSGENLLTRAFGGSRKEALASLEALARSWGTMFSHEYATVAVRSDQPESPPIGVVIAHPDHGNRQTGQRLVEVIVSERGIMQWLRMLPVAIALERCAVPIPPHVTYISILAVAPDYRQQGIGATLMAHAEARALEYGDRALCLDVEIANERAHAFYERLGFRMVSQNPAGPWLKSKEISGLRRLRKQLS